MAASIDLDQALKGVVNAVVKLSGAEEGSLLILDHESGQLIKRAARKFHDDFVGMFNLPVQDTLVREVIRIGRPLIFNQESHPKVVTRYLVEPLMYVPLRVGGSLIGILRLDHHDSEVDFNQDQLSLVSIVADFAAIAIDARFYQHSDKERHKLESILEQIEDGVILDRPENRLILINHNARHLLNLGDLDFFDLPLETVFQEKG